MSRQLPQEGPLKWVALFSEDGERLHLLHGHDIMHCLNAPGDAGWFVPVTGSTYTTEFIVHYSNVGETQQEAVAKLRAIVAADFSKAERQLKMIDSAMKEATP